MCNWHLRKYFGLGSRLQLLFGSNTSVQVKSPKSWNVMYLIEVRTSE